MSISTLSIYRKLRPLDVIVNRTSEFERVFGQLGTLYVTYDSMSDIITKSFKPDYPIFTRLLAPTGCGKSTRLPYLMQQHLKCDVVVIEPDVSMVVNAVRYIAATFTTDVVGFIDGKVVGKGKSIKIYTARDFLIALAADIRLQKVPVVLVDEAHENNGDMYTVRGVVSTLFLNSIRVLVSATFGDDHMETSPRKHKLTATKVPWVPVNAWLEHTDTKVPWHPNSIVNRTLIFVSDDSEAELLLPWYREHGVEAYKLTEKNVQKKFTEVIDYFLVHCTQRMVLLVTPMFSSGITVPCNTVIDTATRFQLIVDVEKAMVHKKKVHIDKLNARQRMGRAGRTEDGHGYFMDVEFTDYTMLDLSDVFYVQAWYTVFSIKPSVYLKNMLTGMGTVTLSLAKNILNTLIHPWILKKYSDGTGRVYLNFLGGLKKYVIDGAELETASETFPFSLRTGWKTVVHEHQEYGSITLSVPVVSTSYDFDKVLHIAITEYEELKRQSENNFSGALDEDELQPRSMVDAPDLKLYADSTSVVVEPLRDNESFISSTKSSVKKVESVKSIKTISSKGPKRDNSFDSYYGEDYDKASTMIIVRRILSLNQRFADLDSVEKKNVIRATLDEFKVVNDDITAATNRLTALESRIADAHTLNILKYKWRFKSYLLTVRLEKLNRYKKKLLNLNKVFEVHSMDVKLIKKKNHSGDSCLEKVYSNPVRVICEYDGNRIVAVTIVSRGDDSILDRIEGSYSDCDDFSISSEPAYSVLSKIPATVKIDDQFFICDFGIITDHKGNIISNCYATEKYVVFPTHSLRDSMFHLGARFFGCHGHSFRVNTFRGTTFGHLYVSPRKMREGLGDKFRVPVSGEIVRVHYAQALKLPESASFSVVEKISMEYVITLVNTNYGTYDFKGKPGLSGAPLITLDGYVVGFHCWGCEYDGVPVYGAFVPVSEEFLEMIGSG